MKQMKKGKVDELIGAVIGTALAAKAAKGIYDTHQKNKGQRAIGQLKAQKKAAEAGAAPVTEYRKGEINEFVGSLIGGVASQAGKAVGGVARGVGHAAGGAVKAVTGTAKKVVGGVGDVVKTGAQQVKKVGSVFKKQPAPGAVPPAGAAQQPPQRK